MIKIGRSVQATRQELLDILRSFDINLTGDMDSSSLLALAQSVSSEFGDHNLYNVGTRMKRKNCGIPRHLMPQVSDKTINKLLGGTKKEVDVASDYLSLVPHAAHNHVVMESFLSNLEFRGVTVREDLIPANQLFATQSDIRSKKTTEIATNYLRGNFSYDQRFLVSGDNNVIDGHHRWAAAMITCPNKPLSVTRIGLPTIAVLCMAVAHPGVYTESVDGNRWKFDHDVHRYKAALRNQSCQIAI